MSGETIQMLPLIPKELEEYIATIKDRSTLDRMVNLLGVPKEFLSTNRFVKYEEDSDQYWIDLKEVLCRRNAIIWLEVEDE